MKRWWMVAVLVGGAAGWWVATHPTGPVTRAILFTIIVPVGAVIIALVQLWFHRAEDWWRPRVGAWWRARR